MKPAIVFDLGKVLVDFDYSIAAAKISARSERPPADLHAYLGASPLLGQYESGTISRAAFFEIIRTHTGFTGSLEEFGGYFAAIFSPIPAMIELQASLRRADYATYIFSNTNDLAIEHIRRDFPFFADFDGYILSYEVGAMKPLAPIYAAMETMCGKRGQQIIYIDDRAENVAAGAARSWRAILHESPEKTIAALNEFGITADC